MTPWRWRCAPGGCVRVRVCVRPRPRPRPCPRPSALRRALSRPLAIRRARIQRHRNVEHSVLTPVCHRGTGCSAAKGTRARKRSRFRERGVVLFSFLQLHGSRVARGGRTDGVKWDMTLPQFLKFLYLMLPQFLKFLYLMLSIKKIET